MSSEPAEVENPGPDTNSTISKLPYPDNPTELTEENETKSTTSSKRSQVSPISEDTPPPYPASDSIPTSSSTLRLRSPVVSDTEEEEQIDNAVEVDTTEEAKPVTLTEVESGSVKGSEDWEVTGEPIELFELEEAEQEAANMADSKKTVQCVGLFLVILIGFCIGMMASSFHIIDEGNVGVYYKQGALVNEVGYPGFNTKAPFITDFVQVTVRPQTSILEPISAITKDGVQNTFNDVQVISNVPEGKVLQLMRKFGRNFQRALIFDRVSEHLRKYCADHDIDEVYNEKFLEIPDYVMEKVLEQIGKLSNGSVEILNLVIPKPDIPPDIAENYKRVKVQWTEQLVAKQQQETQKIKKKTEENNAIADVNRTKAVLEVELTKQILQKEAEKDISLIQNEIFKIAEENKANVTAYTRKKEAEANTLLYSTDGYVALEMAKTLSQNTKLYFSGENSPLGAVFSRIMGLDGSNF